MFRKRILFWIFFILLLAICLSWFGEHHHSESQDYVIDSIACTHEGKHIISLIDLGYPEPCDADAFVMQRKAYVVSYNPEMLIPNWVAWELTAEHADGPWPRDHHYYEDESVPEPRCTMDDYYGIGNLGFSKGHMCPAGDCKWDSTAMSETNLLTNICPQEQGLNSGMWNQIEQACRRWAVKYGIIYIVCVHYYIDRSTQLSVRIILLYQKLFSRWF